MLEIVSEIEEIGDKKEILEKEMVTVKNESKVSENVKTEAPPREILWYRVIISVFLQTFGIAGIFMIDSLKLLIYVFIIINIGILGITAGVHRLWSHRSYKARLPLRVFLMLLNCSIYQGNIYVWCKDHRVHHKYSETDADPYNSKRGFLFSQLGWVYYRKHPDVIEKSKTIDVSDVLADPVVKFQIKYYIPLVIITGIIIPSVIPYFMWNVSLFRCFCICACFRHTYTMHCTGLINSIAHMWGYRPYNPYTGPADNLFISPFVAGEHYHNYHHTFPWDYSSSEYGWKLSFTTIFIDLMAWLGLAYDRKKVSAELVEKIKNKYTK